MNLSMLPDDIIKHVDKYVDKRPPFACELLNRKLKSYKLYIPTNKTFEGITCNLTSFYFDDKGHEWHGFGILEYRHCYVSRDGMKLNSLGLIMNKYAVSVVEHWTQSYNLVWDEYLLNEIKKCFPPDLFRCRKPLKKKRWCIFS